MYVLLKKKKEKLRLSSEISTATSVPTDVYISNRVVQSMQEALGDEK
jgi:hypothetical protein